MRDAAKAGLLILAILLFGYLVDGGVALLAPHFLPDPVGPYCATSHYELRVHLGLVQGHGSDSPHAEAGLAALEVCDAMIPDLPTDPSSSDGHL